jgi:hypothetical protein
VGGGRHGRHLTPPTAEQLYVLPPTARGSGGRPTAIASGVATIDSFADSRNCIVLPVYYMIAMLSTGAGA